MLPPTWMDSHCHVRGVEWAPLAAAREADEGRSGGGGCCDGLGTDGVDAGPPRASLAQWGRQRAGEERAVRCVVCGTHPAIDWDLVAQLALQPPVGVQVIPGFGVHPWFYPLPAETARPEEGSAKSWKDWSDDELIACLEAHLVRFPNAIVGEIGLDKASGPRHRDDAAQRAFFERQLAVAAQHRRPVSVHCVRHYGMLLDVLKDASVKAKAAKANVRGVAPSHAADAFPPAFVIHAFTGSTEIASALLRLPHRIGERIWFGLGAQTSMRVKGFATALLPLLLCRSPGPPRILLETDAHYVYVKDRSPMEEPHGPQVPGDLEVADQHVRGYHELAACLSPPQLLAAAAAFDHVFAAGPDGSATAPLPPSS